MDVLAKRYRNYNASKKTNGHKANIFFIAVTMTSYLRGQFTDVNTSRQQALRQVKGQETRLEHTT